MTQFTEDKLEQAIIALLEDKEYAYHKGDSFTRQPSEVLIKDDLRTFLGKQYAKHCCFAPKTDPLTPHICIEF
ncbi:MAG: hypothetical protein RNU03_00870 [Candidatus Sedimenticola sp. (ex Thyasira tokunagai)]